MLEKFLDELKVNGRSKNTLSLYTSILTAANKHKPLSNWKKEDVNAFLLKLQQEGYSKSTIEINKLMLRKFFNWADKPKFVKHLQIKMPKNNLKRDEILTVEDVNKMIDSNRSPMYKALIALLFESGAREGEILSIKFDDIQETDKGMTISIPQTKTGEDYRRILCLFSSQYIRNHITFQGLSKGKRLFPISHTQVWRTLRETAKEAGIEKPISAHKFRHAQATDMVIRGYQESIIKKKLGWTGDSRMVARYEHIADDDVINATAEMAGENLPRQPKPTLKEAEPLKIADASLMIGKLAAELEENKQKLKEMDLIKSQLDDIKKYTDELRKQINPRDERRGFYTEINASAWEEGTGNVIEWKNGVKSVRKPTVTDYMPDNPLNDPAPEVIIEEQKERARIFDENEKKVLEQAKGVITAAESARRLMESDPHVRAEAEARGALGKKEHDRERAEKVIVEINKKDKEQK